MSARDIESGNPKSTLSSTIRVGLSDLDSSPYHALDDEELEESKTEPPSIQALLSNDRSQVIIRRNHVMNERCDTNHRTAGLIGYIACILCVTNFFVSGAIPSYREWIKEGKGRELGFTIGVPLGAIGLCLLACLLSWLQQKCAERNPAETKNYVPPEASTTLTAVETIIGVDANFPPPTTAMRYIERADHLQGILKQANIVGLDHKKTHSSLQTSFFGTVLENIPPIQQIIENYLLIDANEIVSLRKNKNNDAKKKMNLSKSKTHSALQSGFFGTSLQNASSVHQLIEDYLGNNKKNQMRTL